MKSRNRLTVLESDVIATVDATGDGLGELQIRYLHKGSLRSRFIVVALNELKQMPFHIQILAEAQFNYQSNKLVLLPMVLSKDTSIKVKHALQNILATTDSS